MPGPITSAASAGCHRLIREYGAALVAGERDLAELIAVPGDVWLASLGSQRDDAGAEQERQPDLHRRVLDALPLRGSRTVDELARLAGIEAREAHGALAELELLGSVQRRQPRGEEPQRWTLHLRE